MNLKSLVLAAAVAIAAGAVGVGYAAIPAANGTISACKDNKGSLKVIDAEAGKVCNGTQQLLTWNQQGPAGSPGISGYEVVKSPVKSLVLGKHQVIVEAMCPAGKRVIGGGGVNSAAPGVAATGSHPLLGTTNGWRYYATETTPLSNYIWNAEAWAICANVG